MSRYDWNDREPSDRRETPRRDRDDLGQADYSQDYAYDPETRRGYRAEYDDRPRTDDLGQADYSSDYAYDERGRRAYRRGPDDEARDLREPRSWMDRAADVFGGRSRHDAPHFGPRRPSDRALWEVVAERLAADRSLDLRRVEVSVQDHEVILDGFVRRKADKRRVEDLVDIEGVRHVQNNLRIYERSHWTFL